MERSSLVFVLFVGFLALSLWVVSALGQSGSGIFVNMVACGPPDVPSYEINSTEDQLKQLTLQGRCYTICIGDDLIEDYESV